MARLGKRLINTQIVMIVAMLIAVTTYVVVMIATAYHDLFIDYKKYDIAPEYIVTNVSYADRVYNADGKRYCRIGGVKVEDMVIVTDLVEAGETFVLNHKTTFLAVNPSSAINPITDFIISQIWLSNGIGDDRDHSEAIELKDIFVEAIKNKTPLDSTVDIANSASVTVQIFFEQTDQFAWCGYLVKVGESLAFTPYHGNGETYKIEQNATLLSLFDEYSNK